MSGVPPVQRSARDRSVVRAGMTWLLLIACLAALLLLGGRAGDWVMSQLAFNLSPRTEPVLHRMIMVAIALYILLMALPFCPGIEIGLGLIVLFGPKIVPLVYVSTLVALMLAFLIGRLVPERTIIKAFEVMHLHRARDFLLRLAPLSPEQRLQFLQSAMTTHASRSVLKYRYLALAIALNTPGNVLVGDGGGIAMFAGFSRLFSVPAFALTIMVAVSPVPVAILLGAALS